MRDFKLVPVKTEDDLDFLYRLMRNPESVKYGFTIGVASWESFFFCVDPKLLGSQIVGFIGVTGHHVEIYTIPCYRRNGVGSFMMESYPFKFKPTVELELDNYPAMQFFLSVMMKTKNTYGE